MKEATGELNMTIVIVLAVAALAAFFYLVLWPMIKHNYDSNTQCSSAICTCPDNTKDHKGNCKSTGGMATCHMAGESETFKCPWKG